MKIAIVASEMIPLAKTGGLADVTGALANELTWNGENEVIAFLPHYSAIKQKIDKTEIRGAVIIGEDREEYTVSNFKLPGGAGVFLIGHKSYFNREGLYGEATGDYDDNDRRFIFFQKAVLSILKKINFRPDIIHCHDWQSALIPAYIKTIYRGDPFFSKAKILFTVHNLGYQGLFDRERFPFTSLDWSLFNLHSLEFYGKTNFLKGGLVFSDAITTVSRRYTEEIQTEQFGCGLDGVLRERARVLHGILNGIDYDLWAPEKDALIRFNYSRDNLDGKWKNKEILQKENNLAPQRAALLIGMVTRLVDHKGMDIVCEIFDEIFKMDIQMIILGTGDEKYHNLLGEMAMRHKNRLSLHLKFDNPLAHLIYAGSDLFLMPSLYEPCGLGQMISFRYGTVPLVRETGGLADTVVDFIADRERGNGFSFEKYAAGALLAKLKEGYDVFRTETRTWRSIMERGMAEDLSWRNSTAKYLELYRRLIAA